MSLGFRPQPSLCELTILHRVVHRLLGQAILQLEGGDGQAVDERAHVQRTLGLVAPVAQLPSTLSRFFRLRSLARSIPGDGLPQTRSTWCGPRLMSLRSTSIAPLLVISLCKRARNRRRVGPSSPRRSESSLVSVVTQSHIYL